MDRLRTADVGTTERLPGDGGPGPVRGRSQEDHGERRIDGEEEEEGGNVTGWALQRPR